MNTDVQTAPYNCIAFFYLLHSQQLLREEKKNKNTQGCDYAPCGTTA